MKTLYLCGAGNPEGVRLALVINRTQQRWERLVLLDDNPAKHGQSILGVEIAGPFDLLKGADPTGDEVSNMVARTTSGRQAARETIQKYGLPFATLIDPEVDTEGVDYATDVTIYHNVAFCAKAVVGEGCVVFTGAVVGHGCRMGSCCVVAPGAVINARVELGDGVYLGTNASILPDLKVGAWATIGSNSAVVQDVPEGSTVMGVPAQVLIPGDGASRRQPYAKPAQDASGPRKPAGPVKPQSAGIGPRNGALGRLRAALREQFKRSRK